MNNEKFNEAKRVLESIDHNMHKTYHEILFLCGDYNKLIKQKENSEYKDKAKKLVKLDPASNLDELYKASPHCFEYCQLMFERLITDNKWNAASRIMVFVKNKIDESAGMRMAVHLDILQYETDAVYNGLRNTDVSAYETYKKLENSYEQGINSFENLLALYKGIQTVIKKDTYKPSVYIPIGKKVLERFLFLGIEEKRMGLRVYINELLNIKRTEYAMYLYFMYRLNEKDLSVEQEISKYTFVNDELRNTVKKKLGKLKEEAARAEERRKEEESRKQQQGRQYQQRTSHRTKSSSDDPKGYYKILGLKKNATKKDIKKSWAKLIRSMDPDKQKTEAEKKKMSEDLAKINKAKEVLSDDKQREMYDSGMVEDGTEGGQQYMYNQEVPDIFKMFMNDGFFGGFTGNRGGRTTYTFRTSYL